MRSRPDSPTATHTDDPFAEFDLEQVPTVAPCEERDWFAEFPDEESTPSPAVRSNTWRRLTESLKDDKGDVRGELVETHIPALR